MDFIKVTEQESNHKDLQKKTVFELVNAMHEEDNNALKAVNKVLPNVIELIEEIEPKIKNGGRLFYIGAGTSGRLGVLDASECPPTFGTPPEKVVGLVAGGIPALYSSIEIAEDDLNQAWKDLSEHNISSNDIVIGIAASGTTPYVIGGLQECRSEEHTSELQSH
jgi:N-acetylmuramic acid 6-phosphate etherase